MTDLMSECEQSFYMELYHYDSGDRSIVMDTVSGRICLKKVLSIYNENVFSYLRSHCNIHIPRVHTFWKENDRLCVIEELISGNTLDYILQNNHPSDEQKRDYLLQICDGLAFLHHASPKIIHRDLKPSNIMVTDDGIVKIIDYDAAKTFDQNETADTMLIGTRGSAAPEQYGFGKVDERTDIYALGILIQELFPGDPKMCKIAAKASQLNPRDRYQNVEQLRTHLEPHRHNGDPIRFRGIPGFRTRTPWKMLVAILGYLGILGYALTYTPNPGSDHTSAIDILINRIGLVCFGLAITDLVTGWSGLYQTFPLMRQKNPFLKFCGFLLDSVILLFFWACVCVFLENIF